MQNLYTGTNHIYNQQCQTMKNKEGVNKICPQKLHFKCAYKSDSDFASKLPKT